jgi:hypothetical protein
MDTQSLSDLLRHDADVGDDPLCRRMLEIACRPTGTTSSGYPYLQRRAFEDFRDTVPHLFAMGRRVIECQARLQQRADASGAPAAAVENLERACRVMRQIARTACITAPTDLWLMRHVLGTHNALGLNQRLLDGEAIHPEFCEVEADGQTVVLDAEQLEIDLHFLLARGVVEQYDESFRIAGHERARRLLSNVEARAEAEPVPATPLWREAFTDGELTDDELRSIVDLGASVPPPRESTDQNHWIPTVDEVQIGYRLVPVVLGLRAADLTAGHAAGDSLQPVDLSTKHAEAARAALDVLFAAGWVDAAGAVTPLGERGFSRGAGPFGIIQTYYEYMALAAQILMEGGGGVHVKRGENVGASQDANRATFRKANDALDRFCEDTGFDYSVFIEHAIGRGEATRQRYERSGEESIRYFGADLEDPAIDAAIEEKRAGRLPENMVFVRHADIGDPDRLIVALRREQVDPWSAVMVVGNGFHEVRGQTDEMMREVFEGYHEAGIILLFTEENALSIDDLRATAWNTYHAGFKYVHEKSGQCLRPASPRPRPRLGPPLRAAWSECASAAGYVRADDYCSKTRTIYPHPRRDGHNPSISVNHFFVPAPIARRLGLDQ